MIADMQIGMTKIQKAEFIVVAVMGDIIIQVIGMDVFILNRIKRD